MRLNVKLAFGVLAVVLIVVAFLSLFKKDKNPLKIDVSKVDAPVVIKNFDHAFFTSDTLNWVAEIARLKRDFDPFFAQNDFAKFWYDQRVDPLQNNLFQAWVKINPDPEKFNQKLLHAFKHLYYYYPNYPPAEVYTYISRLDFEYPVLHADAYLFVATDLYLGKNNTNYGGMPDYLRYFRQPEFLLTEVMESYAMRLNTKDLQDNSLLNEMIYWGKNLYFAQAMLPDAPDTAIIRYSSKKLDFALANEQAMWTYFIDNKLIFNTTDDVRRRFVDAAPFSKFGMPFDNETPGMIGRWIGWRIVQSYMKNNPDVSLPQLMANKDFNTIFKYSKYKP